MPVTPFHPVIDACLRNALAFRPTPKPWLARDPGWTSYPDRGPYRIRKTLAAFLASIDQLLRQGIEGRLENRIEVIYVSPLKALSNDIRRNLEGPLEEISMAALEGGPSDPLDSGGRSHGRYPGGRTRGDAEESPAYPGHNS
jgi:ATP-dependent Lhr-like helicase